MSLWLLSCVPLVMEGTSCLSPQQPHAWLQRTAVTGWMSLGPHPPHTHGSQTHLQLGPSYLQVNNHNILNLRYVYLPSGSCAFMDNKLLFIVSSKTSACFRGVNFISLLGWGVSVIMLLPKQPIQLAFEGLSARKTNVWILSWFFKLLRICKSSVLSMLCFICWCHIVHTRVGSRQ